MALRTGSAASRLIAPRSAPLHGVSATGRPREESLIVRTAFVSTYPPRRCGIATFTHDLAAATGRREIVALDGDVDPLSYSPEVHHRIRRDHDGDYGRAARSLGACVDVVSIQHEFGIWGGPDGAYVLDFVRALTVPAVTTLHTVLKSPTAGQRAVLSELVARSDATVVMSRSAAALLVAVYGVERHKLDIVPHGVPDLPLVDPATVKASFGVDGRDVILSFGLLGPGKGYELALEALPAVVAAHPAACYVIVGATHPNLLRTEGEAYRVRLTQMVGDLGLRDHVRFVDRFVGHVELMRWLEAADVFVTPYPHLDQIVSGTLSYAMGAGRAIVSTPYTYAAELLSDGRGLLVTPGSPRALANALTEVLSDRALRATLGARAHAYSRRMVWSAVGAEYRRVFERVAAGRAVPPRIPTLAALRA
ncbi:MAG TPA: glycosyltransferase family 4 protein [Candidatus Dormibacteraeota bacterium]|nr:glycosyltransferase family 4 protein [Candidatus Dormibacteraeota bacterium]